MEKGCMWESYFMKGREELSTKLFLTKSSLNQNENKNKNKIN